MTDTTLKHNDHLQSECTTERCMTQTTPSLRESLSWVCNCREAECPRLDKVIELIEEQRKEAQLELLDRLSTEDRISHDDDNCDECTSYGVCARYEDTAFIAVERAKI